MAKNKAPAFQFYPRDYLTDIQVVVMTLEEQGAYIRLLSHQWLEGSIPADTKHLACLCRITPARMKKIWPAIAPKFREAAPGRLVNDRLEQSRKTAAEWREKSKEGGIRSARIREAKRKGTHTQAQWIALVDACDGVCPRCKTVCEGFHKDHVVPIYQGGSDAIDNLQPLCGRCNSAKGSEAIDYVAHLRNGGKGGSRVVQPNGNSASASALTPSIEGVVKGKPTRVGDVLKVLDGGRHAG